MTTHAKEIHLVSGQVLKDRDISFIHNFMIVSDGDNDPLWYNMNQVAEMHGVAPSKSRVGVC